MFHSTETSEIWRVNYPPTVGDLEFLKEGVQVQADYGNSTDCFIMAGEHVYVEAAKLAPIRAKRRKF